MGHQPGAPTAPLTESSEDLVNQVKNAQRRSEDWKDAWHKLCDSEGGGVRDPGRHSPPLLMRFLEACERSPQNVHQALGLPPTAPINHELVQQVKQAQRMHEGWKEVWHRMCDTEQGGCRDPNRHPEEFLRRYLATLRNAEAYEQPTAASLTEGVDHATALARLVAEVKHVQRLSSEWKFEWETLCDSQGGGIRDPNRHNFDFLRQFLERYERARGVKRPPSLPEDVEHAAKRRLMTPEAS